MKGMLLVFLSAFLWGLAEGWINIAKENDMPVIYLRILSVVILLSAVMYLYGFYGTNIESYVYVTFGWDLIANFTSMTTTGLSKYSAVLEQPHLLVDFVGALICVLLAAFLFNRFWSGLEDLVEAVVQISG